MDITVPRDLTLLTNKWQSHGASVFRSANFSYQKDDLLVAQGHHLSCVEERELYDDGGLQGGCRTVADPRSESE